MMESEYLAIFPNETEPVDFWERYYYSKARPYINVLLTAVVVMISRLNFMKLETNMLKNYCKETVKDTRWIHVAVTDPTEQFVKKDRQTEQVLRKVHY